MNQLKDKMFSDLHAEHGQDSHRYSVEDEIPIAAMPIINEKAFFGIVKDFIDISSSNSEASKVAIAANVIAHFSAMIGRRAYQWIGDNVIHCRPFFLLIGKTGKSRKGTSEHLPLRVSKRVDEIFKEKFPNYQSLNIHGGGLSSGEGISYAIRDASDKGDDPGVEDKRLLVIEPEFANTLANCKRETSTLSATIRNVFDGRDLAPLTKNNRTRASKPHVVILAHITKLELNAKSSILEISNGLLNRFLICAIAREKLVALPSKTPDEKINMLANNLVGIMEFIDQQPKDSNQAVEVCMNQEAEVLWVKAYPRLSNDRDGHIGALMARVEVYARMLAMIFCLLDKKIVIEVSHLEAAFYWIAYVESSIMYLFNDVNKQKELNDTENLSQRILNLFKTQESLSKTEINKAFNGHIKSKEIEHALSFLLNLSPPPILQIIEKTGGKDKYIFKLVPAEKAEKAKKAL